MSIVQLREFRVNVRHGDRHHARVVREASFEAAAIAYLDDYAQPPEDGPGVNILVHELATGQEHCFQVDFDTGDVIACG